MKTSFLLGAMTAAALICPQAAWSRDHDGTCGPGNTPLIVDVKGDGINLGPEGVGVYFDLSADGTPQHLQWVRGNGDEAFLMADLNGNSIVDNGSELFGEGTTLLLTGAKARNGFIALAQYDAPALGGNDDGQISSADSIWPTLRLWTDANADGRSTLSEVKAPDELGLISFGVVPKTHLHVDDAGNVIPFYAWVRKAAGRRVLMVDVFFQSLP